MRPGEGRNGARKPREGRLPAHPPPPEQRVPAAAPCRPHYPRPCPAPRGASGAPRPWEPEPGGASTDRFPSRKLALKFLDKSLGQLGSGQPELATFP